MQNILSLKVFFLLAIALIFLYSCKHEPIDIEGFEIAANTCDTSEVRFSEHIQSIIETKCNSNSGCHVTGGLGTGDFETYLGLKEKVDNSSFQNRVFDIKTMPPAGSPALDDCEISLISSWINQGALNN